MHEVHEDCPYCPIPGPCTQFHCSFVPISPAQAVLYAFENFARRMVHQFPCNPTAQVRAIIVFSRYWAWVAVPMSCSPGPLLSPGALLTRHTPCNQADM